MNEFEYLVVCVEFIKCKKYDIIYQFGEWFDCLFFLIKGVVKIGWYFFDGWEIIKYVFYFMSMFGEFCLVGEFKWKDFVVVIKKDM